MKSSLARSSAAKCRAAFSLPDDVAYFNCAYFSPMLNAAIEAGRLTDGKRAHPWEIAEEDFFAETEKARHLFAEIVNTSSENVAIVPSASYGFSIACRNIKFEGQRRKVLLVENEHPSNFLQWQHKARLEGGELECLSLKQLRESSEALCDAIDERTAVVSVPTCHWTEGTLVDLKRVAIACRRMGAALVVDGTQSVGVLNFKFDDIQPDYLIVAGYKWLLGPYSVGFMAVRSDRQSGIPLELNRYNYGEHEKELRWESGGIRYPEGPRRGARRFDVGESANFCLLPMVNVALQWILERNMNLRLDQIAGIADSIIDVFSEYGLKPISGQNHAPHLFGLDVAKSGAPFLNTFARHKVFATFYGESVRISPNVYNTDRDVKVLTEAVHDAMRYSGR